MKSAQIALRLWADRREVRWNVQDAINPITYNLCPMLDEGTLQALGTTPFEPKADSDHTILR